ncbi:MAG TPA: MerR family transcriptional regulator, partial [Flavisolibacter sp.]
MQEFSIRDIEHLTGIRSHTLRIWEQRYSFFKPKRKESLRRTYDNEDLKQLLRVSFLYHKGWKISRIASLTPEQVSREVYGTEVAQGENRLYVTRLL